MEWIPRCSCGTNTPTTHQLFNTPEIPAQDIVLPVSSGAHGSVIKRNSLERIAGQIICGLNDPRADLLRSVDRRIAEADVINIHKVEHFVDLPALLGRLPPSKPVVITLHDLSPITGGCDYPGSCRRFEAACGCCPIIDSHRSNDYSHRIFRMKEMAYLRPSRERLAFVANSVWSGEQARHSALTKDRTVEVIHYGLDQDVYSPRKRREAREALGIGAEEPVLLFAAHDLGLAAQRRPLLTRCSRECQLPTAHSSSDNGRGTLSKCLRISSYPFWPG